MENIPQPSDSPYDVGQRVRIYLSDDDIDAQYHGLVCEIIGDEPDDLGDLTGRDVDSHHYRLRRIDTGDELSLSFRHEDLVAESEWPVRE
jgi:hypothetical protein